MKIQMTFITYIYAICAISSVSFLSCQSAEQKANEKQKDSIVVAQQTVDTNAINTKLSDTNALGQKQKVAIDTLFYKHAGTFKSYGDSAFKYNDLLLIFNEEANRFETLTKREPYYIALDERYDGPGFQLDIYEPISGADKYFLVIEAQGDPGTDWYMIAKVEDNKVVLKQKINEPRANSEETGIEKFLSIYEIGNTAVLQFKKKWLAGYSSVPKDMKQDKGNFYLEFAKK